MTSNPGIFDRRSGQRRVGQGDARRAPHGRERRSGVDRRAATATAVAVGMGVAMGLGALGPPAAAEDGPWRRPRTPASPAAATSTSTSGNPLAGVQWYVDPGSDARKQAEAWRPTRPADAAQMEKIAFTGGQAKWFGDWNPDVQASVDRHVTAVTAAGALPVLVAYNIPNRDCGQHSSGGASGAPAYRDWVRRFALGIGGRPAVVILEPDALGHLSQCGTAAEKQQRLDLLWDAVQVLKADAQTRVYIDAGHSAWLSADTAADRLHQAGIAQADGFATNVSNFNPIAAEIAYGDSISDRLGGTHFVIDTSRNGLGPAPTWCNPGGQGLGHRPTATTGSPRVDAFLWIKTPGESDGACNGGPRAGAWWPEYALGLAQRAAF